MNPNQSTTFAVTDYTIYPYPARDDSEQDAYSADVVINDKWIVQRGTDGEFSAPYGHQCFVRDEKEQDDWVLALECGDLDGDLDVDGIADALGLAALLDDAAAAELRRATA